jgi:excisionase family DNA binding protein
MTGRPFDSAKKRPPKPNLSVQWIAQQLEVDRATIVREIERKNLAAYKIGGQWRVTFEDYQAYLAERRNRD